MVAMLIADLHIHSKYSRATSRDLSLIHILCGGGHPPLAAEEGAGDQRHNGHLGAAGNKGGGHNGHLAVAVLLLSLIHISSIVTDFVQAHQWI